MKVAVVGCAHGDLNVIYNSIAHTEKLHSLKIELLICCGDFQVRDSDWSTFEDIQAVRNTTDLGTMAVKDKYKELKDFHRYYYGELTAPIFTIFIGGNHEASNHLQEL